MDSKVVVPLTESQPARHRGPLNSQDYNKVQEAMIADIQNISNVVNSLNARLSRNFTVLQNENSYLRRLVDSLKNQQMYSEKVSSHLGTLASRFIDFSDTTGLSFPDGIIDTRSAFLSSEFGEVTLPTNATENKFYVTSLFNNKIVTPGTLRVSVLGEFDKKDGEGLVNYEKGGIVYSGVPENAFNGLNDSYWIRKVVFPLDSRVDEVECELTVIIPEGSSSEANVLELVPFPNGSVDVLELARASDLGDNFTRIEGFVPTNNLVAKRYHFSPVPVDQIKIRIRQRNWIEEDGKKVFYYGLQELGLKLVDYDKAYTQGAVFGSNNSFVVKVASPDGYSFNKLFRIDPSPNFLLEDMSNRHVHLRIGLSSEISNGVIWDSDSEYTPQQSNVPIVIGSSVFYVFIELNFVESSGGNLSPFPIGTTPFMNGVGFAYNLLTDS